MFSRWQERQIIIYLLVLNLFVFSGLKPKTTMFCFFFSDFAFSKGGIYFLIYSIWKQTQLIFPCPWLIAKIISEVPWSSLAVFQERWKKNLTYHLALFDKWRDVGIFQQCVWVSNSHQCFFRGKSFPGKMFFYLHWGKWLYLGREPGTEEQVHLPPCELIILFLPLSSFRKACSALRSVIETILVVSPLSRLQYFFCLLLLFCPVDES